MDVVAMEKRGAAFSELQPLVSGARGRTVYETGDVNAVRVVPLSHPNIRSSRY